MKAKQLIEEIHRRSIWQLLAIYIGGSFSVVGNVELLTGTFGFPAWLLPGSLVLLAVGVISMFGVKLWPKVSRPSPEVRRAGAFGVVYILLAMFLVSIVGPLNEQTLLPDLVFRASLVALATFLPVAMALGYLQAKKRSDAIGLTTPLTTGISTPLHSPVRTAGVSGALFFFVGWQCVFTVGMLDRSQEVPETLFPGVLTMFLVLLPVVVILAYSWRKRHPIPAPQWVCQELLNGRSGQWVWSELVSRGVPSIKAVDVIRAAAGRVELETGTRPQTPAVDVENTLRNE